MINNIWDQNGLFTPFQRQRYFSRSTSLEHLKQLLSFCLHMQSPSWCRTQLYASKNMEHVSCFSIESSQLQLKNGDTSFVNYSPKQRYGRSHMAQSLGNYSKLGSWCRLETCLCLRLKSALLCYYCIYSHCLTSVLTHTYIDAITSSSCSWSSIWCNK